MGRRRNLWGALGRRRNLWFAAQRGRLLFSLRGCRSQEEPVVPENDHVLFFGGLWVAGGTCGGLWVAGGTYGSLPREGACSFPWGIRSQEESEVRCAERAPILFLEGLSVAGGTCGSRERPRSFLWGPLGRRRNLRFAAQRGRLFFSLRGCRSQEEPVVPENDHVLFFGGLWVAGGTCEGF
jgi:hypothetical protein